jgi:transcription antitermination protein NusB
VTGAAQDRTADGAGVNTSTNAEGVTKPSRKAGKTGAGKSGRRRSRELVLQGLYEWQLAQGSADGVAAHIREIPDFARCDAEHFDALLQGCIAEAATLDALLAPSLDRKTSLLSPVEHAVLWIGLYELQHCVEIPYRVVINEAVELAKSFGGTDGHKYVNGVLDKLASTVRAAEVGAAPPRRSAPEQG